MTASSVEGLKLMLAAIKAASLSVREFDHACRLMVSNVEPFVVDRFRRLVLLIRRPFRRAAAERACRIACRDGNVERVFFRYIRRAGRGRPIRGLGKAVKK